MLNPFIEQQMGSLVRTTLKILGGYLIAHALATEVQVSQLVEALVPIIVAALWSAYTVYKSRQKLLTAQAMPAGVTENDVKAQIKEVGAPPVTLQKDEVPLTP